MSVYVSNTDETASANQTGNFMIAGYVADEQRWPEFSRRWAEEVLSNPTIPYLHMVQMRSESWRKEHGIGRSQATDKVLKAAKIIIETDFLSAHFSQVSEVAYLKALKALEDAKVESNPKHRKIDYICFIAYAVRLLQQIATERPEVEKLTFNISRKQQVSHHLENELHDLMMEELKLTPILRKLFGDVVPLSQENHMPLQAADLLAWHLQRGYAKHTVDELEIQECVAILNQRELNALDIPDSAMEQLANAVIQIHKDSTKP